MCNDLSSKDMDTNDAHGHSWTPMDIHGHPWAPMDIHGYPWTSMDMDTNGHLWTFMDLYGPLWISMDLHGHPQKLVEFHQGWLNSMELGQIPLRSVNNSMCSQILSYWSCQVRFLEGFSCHLRSPWLEGLPDGHQVCIPQQLY